MRLNEKFTNYFYVHLQSYASNIKLGIDEKAIIFNKEDAITGMIQSVKHFLGAKKKFEDRSIRLRNNENAVVFYE